MAKMAFSGDSIPFIDISYEYDVYNDLVKSDNVYVPKFLKLSHMILSKYKECYHELPELRYWSMFTDEISDSCFLWCGSGSKIKSLTEMAKVFPEYYLYLMIVSTYFRNKMCFLYSCSLALHRDSPLIWTNEYIGSGYETQGLWPPSYLSKTNDREWGLTDLDHLMIINKADHLMIINKASEIFVSLFQSSEFDGLYSFMSKYVGDIATIHAGAYVTYKNKLNTINKYLVAEMNGLYGEIIRPDYFAERINSVTVSAISDVAVAEYESLKKA